jgi:hypothetical protein
MNSAQFKTEVGPILYELHDGTYDRYEPEFKQIFREIKGMERNQHVVPVLGGFEPAKEYESGTELSYTTSGEVFVATGLYKEYSLAFSIPRKLADDGDAVNFGSRYAEELAISMREAEEIESANWLNRAFNSSYPVGDGVSLINTAHKGLFGFTYSNNLNTAAALSQTTLEQQLIQVRKSVDFNNKPIRLKPKDLVVSPDQMNTAIVLLQSTQRAGTANNDTNPLKAMGLDNMKPVVMTRMTSPVAFFVTTQGRGVDKNGLLFVRRIAKPEREMLGDFETKSMRYSLYNRFVTLPVDPHAIFGNAGV